MTGTRPDAGTIAHELDRLLSETALVVGSPPPQGRDLDLVLSPQGREALESALAAEGWMVRPGRCARFRDCSADVVELLGGRDIGIPEAQLSEVLDEAVLLEGCSWVRLPAPHHALLILARRVARARGPLPDKHRRKIDSYQEADPAVWEAAWASSTDWGATDALDILSDVYAGRPVSPARRAAAVAQELKVLGTGPGGVWARACLSVLPRPPRHTGYIVALSGLDGAGKSTQARALKEALERLGYEAEVRWSSLLHYPGSLELLRRTIDRILTLTRLSGSAGSPATQTAPAPTHGGVGPTDTAAKRLRQGSRLVATVWIALVAVRNGLEHRRITRSRLTRGHIVICDRYVLDSLVQLRYQYGGSHSIELPARLVRLLSPRPDRAYFLRVPADTASTRKDDYHLEENLRRAHLYDEECDGLGVRRLDGQRSPSDLCAELARDVWAGLTAEH